MAAEEVENHLLAHPAVRDVAVVSKPDVYLGERTFAFVVGEGTTPRAVELRVFLRERGLAAYKIPDGFRSSTSSPSPASGRSAAPSCDAPSNPRSSPKPLPTVRHQMSLPRSVSYPMPTQLPDNRASWRIDPGPRGAAGSTTRRSTHPAFDRTADPIRTMIANVDAHPHPPAGSRVFPIMYTAQPGDQDPEHRALLTDFWGPGLSSDPAATAIIADLAPEPDDVLLTKWRYSAFARTDLRQRCRTSAGTN